MLNDIILTYSIVFGGNDKAGLINAEKSPD